MPQLEGGGNSIGETSDIGSPSRPAAPGSAAAFVSVRNRDFDAVGEHGSSKIDRARGSAQTSHDASEPGARSPFAEPAPPQPLVA